MVAIRRDLVKLFRRRGFTPSGAHVVLQRLVSFRAQNHPKNATDSAEQVDQDIVNTRRSAGDEALMKLIAGGVKEYEHNRQRGVMHLPICATVA